MMMKYKLSFNKNAKKIDKKLINNHTLFGYSLQKSNNSKSTNFI